MKAGVAAVDWGVASARACGLARIGMVREAAACVRWDIASRLPRGRRGKGGDVRAGASSDGLDDGGGWASEPGGDGGLPGSQGPGLFTAVVNAPRLAEAYFARRWYRKPLWYTLSFAFAYFSANTISLAFGARAINDVVAAVLFVVFYETASRVVYRAERRTVWHYLLNFFKMGVVLGFLMDQYKLGS